MKTNALRKLLAAILLVIAGISSPALSRTLPPSLSERQLEILRTVRSVDGYVNEELHREFWALMPEVVRDDPAVPELMDDLLAEVNDARQDFQKHTWLSARESLRAGKVVRTPEYVQASEAARTASANLGYRESLTSSIASAERLIVAAANGTPLDAAGGRTFITEDLIERVLSGISASEFRFSKLIEQPWDGSLTQFDYPEAHVSMLAVTPFTVERKHIRNPDARDLEVVMLSQLLGPSTYVSVNFTPIGGRYSDPIKSLVSNASAAVEGAGATGRRPVALQWRGLNSAIATGSAQTSEGEFFISVRVVEVPEISGIIQFAAVSQISAADAINERGKLEDSANIIR